MKILEIIKPIINAKRNSRTIPIEVTTHRRRLIREGLLSKRLSYKQESCNKTGNYFHYAL